VPSLGVLRKLLNGEKKQAGLLPAFYIFASCSGVMGDPLCQLLTKFVSDGGRDYVEGSPAIITFSNF
jgi:hypothetical protein